jgi:A/G-specific adenine glycosylase
VAGVTSPFPASAVRSIRRAVLAFYDARRRPLPWRASPDPYRVWISEIMLQQTRVETVVPYYERWLARFPDLDALADAEPDAVLAAWAGLGYYSRARNLHRAARLVRERHGGRLPETAAALQALPGMGEYTAGAIASIAFGRAEPAIDGNVRRVLARVLDIEAPAPAALRATAAALVPARRPGDFNQALMELGATVCTPRRPACHRCPLARWCAARANGTQHERPAPRRAAPVPTFAVGTALVRTREGRVLVARRPEHGLLAGLWEFPGAELRPGETARAAARRVARRLTRRARLGRAIPLASVEHAFSHRRETYHVHRFDIDAPAGDAPPATPVRWLEPAALRTLAMPAAQRRIAAAFLDGGTDPSRRARA